MCLNIKDENKSTPYVPIEDDDHPLVCYSRQLILLVCYILQRKDLALIDKRIIVPESLGDG
jgi:hypothetical protein